MNHVRHIISVLVIAIVFAMTLNGVAAAANDPLHQAHCVDAFGETAEYDAAEHSHDHDGFAAKHATPGHDHETCMMHACPALAAETIKFRAFAETLMATLSWPETPLHALERDDGLKRPPKS